MSTTRRRRTWIRRLFSLLKRAVVAGAAIILLVFIASTVFIGVECYGSGGRSSDPPGEVQRVAAGISGYARAEASTFLTLPEWYIVYSTEEYARFIESNPPSRFPYFGSIRQYWRYYGGVCRATKGVYPFSTGNHLMLAVIGSSFSIEYGIKGLYEKTIGRLSEWIGGHQTPEDAFAHRAAVEYGTFMHTVPWYEFPFRQKLAAMWKETPLWGPHAIRKWERRSAVSLEYGTKAVYGWMIGRGSQATYGAEDLLIHAWIENVPDDLFADGHVKKVRQVGPRSCIVTIPRYEEFTARVAALASQGVRFLDIAGNDDILVTALAPADSSFDQPGATVIVTEPVLTDPATKRIAVKVSVRSLSDLLVRLRRERATLEHIYDY